MTAESPRTTHLLRTALKSLFNKVTSNPLIGEPKVLLVLLRIKVTVAAAGHSQQLVPLKSTMLLSMEIRLFLLNNNSLIAHGHMVTTVVVAVSSQTVMPM